MNREAIRRYAERPWDEIEKSRAEYWAREFAENGPGAAIRAAHTLWLHMRSIRPGWPSEEDRAEDLAHHVEWRAILDRAGRGLRDR